MFDSLGYYFLFLFKVSLSLILSLILYSIHKKDTNLSLKFYSSICVMITALVAVSKNIALKEGALILPLMILSLFIILSIFMVSKSYKEEDFLHYFLIIALSISIGLGYYFSSLTLSLIICIINYSFGGMLKFFSNEEEDISEVEGLKSFELEDKEELLEDNKEDK